MFDSFLKKKAFTILVFLAQQSKHIVNKISQEVSSATDLFQANPTCGPYIRGE